MVLSIIIINYNSKGVLIDCLNSLFDSNYPFKFEVFVVDNASSENIVEVESMFPEVKFIFNKVNLGFAAANNIGIKLATGKFILLLNPDTIVNENSFPPMIKYLEENNDVGVVGCKLFSPDGNIQRSAHSFPTLSKEFVHANQFIKQLLSYDSVAAKFLKNFNTKSLSSYGDQENIKEVGHVTGACMMLKKDVIDKVGMLDEAFFMYNEEVEWSMRIKNAGYKSIFFPHSNIIHLFGHSTKQKIQKQTLNNLLVERYRGMFYLFQKHYSPFKLFLLRLIVLQGFSFRLIYHYVKKFFELGSNKEIMVKEIFFMKEIIKLSKLKSFDWRDTRS